MSREMVSPIALAFQKQSTIGSSAMRDETLEFYKSFNAKLLYVMEGINEGGPIEVDGNTYEIGTPAF